MKMKDRPHAGYESDSGPSPREGPPRPGYHPSPSSLGSTPAFDGCDWIQYTGVS